MKVIIGFMFGITVSACSVGMSMGDGLAFVGSPEAIQAFYDGENGLIASAKTQDPLMDSAHWQHRKQQEQEKTKRLVPPSFWSKLTGGASNVK